MDLGLREEAPSHGPTGSFSSSASSAQPSSATAPGPGGTAPTSYERPGEHALTDEQRARGYGPPGGTEGPKRGSGEWSGMQPHMPAYPPARKGPYGTIGSENIKSEPLAEPGAPPSASQTVPIQPRPYTGLGLYGQSAPAYGKARSNSWSYPASATGPYPYPASSASSAPAAQRSSYRYARQPPGGLSVSAPEESMQRQQMGQALSMSYPPQPTTLQQHQQQANQFLSFGGPVSGYSSMPYQATATPPLPTTPSSFIRRTSLPQTYLHTIPIARPSGFAPVSAEATQSSAQAAPAGLPPTAETKLEIPTQGARALPPEIASHPAIQSITKSHSGDQATSEGEKGAGATVVTGEEGAGLGGEVGEETGPPTLERAAVSGEGKFVDISEYLNLPQSKVAKALGIPSSTLSKRWKEAARARKWPWRTVCKIDKEIVALLHNIPPSVAAKGPEHVPPEIQTRLLALLKQRQDELKPVIIRL